jgi:hypothetical protein
VGVRWWIRGTPSALLERLVAGPDPALQGPQSTARRRVGRKLFYHLAQAGSPSLFVKVFRPRAGPALLLSWLRPSKAWREAAIAAAVGARGFAAAVPVAVGEQRRGGLLLRSFSVIEAREATDLRALLAADPLDRARRRQLLESFGALNRRLHDAGIDQDDTSPNNFLVDAQGGTDPWILIDFERCRVGPVLAARRRWALLAKLHRHDLGVSRSDRLRFLRAYLGPACDRTQRRSACAAIASEFARIRSRDARRAARGAFAAGRHVARESGSWVVRGREQVALLRLDLDARGARRAWVLAHQLERLGLPALRPARLDSQGLAMVAPDPESPLTESPLTEPLLTEPPLTAPASERAIERARHQFEQFGRFVSEPQWIPCRGGAVLRDPRAFRPFRGGPLARSLRDLAARYWTM